MDFSSCSPSVMNKSLEPVFLLYAKTATTLRKTQIDRPVRCRTVSTPFSGFPFEKMTMANFNPSSFSLPKLPLSMFHTTDSCYAIFALEILEVVTWTQGLTIIYISNSVPSRRHLLSAIRDQGPSEL